MEHLASVAVVKELPILFSGPLVKAILEGRKSQTRRLVKYVPSLGEPESWCPSAVAGHIEGGYQRFCPYGDAPNGRLWVRETWAIPPGSDARDDVAYRADLSEEQQKEERSVRRLVGRIDSPWRPSIHMPRWASRITLKITDVRVERLQYLTEEDAKAEGVDPIKAKVPTHRDAFRMLWDEINGERATWASSPWVWAISFRRLPGATP